MKLRFAPTIFMVAFCCAYIFVFAMDWPLFRYYPLHGEVSWGRILHGTGPAITWYGLMANAAIFASLLAICVPDRAVDRLFRDYMWLFPCTALLACIFLLRHFFI